MQNPHVELYLFCLFPLFLSPVDILHHSQQAANLVFFLRRGTQRFTQRNAEFLVQESYELSLTKVYCPHLTPIKSGRTSASKTTSIRNGPLWANAFWIAGAMSSGFSTRMPPTPIERAISSKRNSGLDKSKLRGYSCCGIPRS